MDGPYFPLTTIIRNVHLMVQNGGPTKCHMVPVDYVAKAFYTLFEDEASVGGVFVLGDPNPLTYGEFFDVVCERWGKMKPLLKLPPALIRPMFFLPFFSRIIGVPYEAFRYSFLPVEYDMTKSVAALEKHGLACPAVSEYLDVMLDYFKKHRNDPGVRKEMWRESSPRG
jgi:nucleoside-diphosphate-sugar epimerase